RDGVPDAAPRLRFLLVRRVDHQLDGLDLGLGVLRLLLELGELPPALGGPLDEHLCQLGGAETAAGLFRDGQGERLGPQTAGALRRDRRRAPDGTPRDLVSLADADEQDPLSLARAVDEERLVFLTVVVARGNGALQICLELRYRSLSGEQRQEWRVKVRERLRRDD